MDQFSYYMIRIQRSSGEHPPELLAGVVERLGTGEKEHFANDAELLQLLSGWSDGLPNMRPAGEGGKA